MILEVLSGIIPIIALIVLGFVLHEKKFLSKGLDRNLTFLVMNVALPASVFLSVVNNLTVKTLEELAKPLVIGLIVFGANYMLSYFIMRLSRVPRGRKGIFLNTVVNANTIFIGMPLNQALFGTEAISYFLVYYVLNTLSTWTVGAVFIARDGRTQGAGGRKGKSQADFIAADSGAACSAAGVVARHSLAKAGYGNALLSGNSGDAALPALHRHCAVGGGASECAF